MKIIALTCCKKKVHKTCLEKFLENYAQCAYCKALIDPKNKRIHWCCLSSTRSNKFGCWNQWEQVNKQYNGAHVKESLEWYSKARCNGEKMTSSGTKSWENETLESSRYWKIDVSPGTVVTIQVDSRDVSHPQGILGFVVPSKKDTGAVLVVCASGLICATEKKVDYWIPIEAEGYGATEDYF